MSRVRCTAVYGCESMADTPGENRQLSKEGAGWGLRMHFNGERFMLVAVWCVGNANFLHELVFFYVVRS